MMQRLVATLPESMPDLCLIRLGLQVRRLSAFPFVFRLGKAIERSAAEAMASGAGLLKSEQFVLGWNHVGILQYWRSFEELEAWSHASPHSQWWKEANERSRKRGDFGIYHEAYLVPRDALESIYIDCKPVGLASFGQTGEAVGSATTSRDRLGRRLKR